MIHTHSLEQQSIAERFSTDIACLKIIVYTGSDEAARQKSCLVTGSLLVRQMLSHNEFRLQRVIDLIIDMARYVVVLLITKSLLNFSFSAEQASVDLEGMLPVPAAHVEEASKTQGKQATEVNDEDNKEDDGEDDVAVTTSTIPIQDQLIGADTFEQARLRNIISTYLTWQLSKSVLIFLYRDLILFSYRFVSRSWFQCTQKVSLSQLCSIRRSV